MAGQPLFSNYMGLDPLMRTIGQTTGFGTQGNDPAQAEAGVQALKGFMTPVNNWYAQNFGLGGSIPSFVDNIYSKFYGREADAPGKEFWSSKANEYKTKGTEDTADDKTDAETQAWLMTHFLGRSDEFSNKYAGEQAAYGGKPADYKDAADWQGYRNNARMQRQALNSMPYTLDPARLSMSQSANKEMMYPAALQQGGVPRQVVGGVNIAPTVDAANNYAGLTSELTKLGLEGDTLSQVMDLVKNAANLNKGDYTLMSDVMAQANKKGK